LPLLVARFAACVYAHDLRGKPPGEVYAAPLEPDDDLDILVRLGRLVQRATDEGDAPLCQVLRTSSGVEFGDALIFSSSRIIVSLSTPAERSLSVAARASPIVRP
jgi:hypothetical protein